MNITDSERANAYRRYANKMEDVAKDWLLIVKNKAHHTNIRRYAAARYRNNMRSARKYRDMAKRWE